MSNDDCHQLEISAFILWTETLTRLNTVFTGKESHLIRRPERMAVESLFSRELESGWS
jgi:hypothetical protein